MLKIGMIVHPRGLIAPQLYRIADIMGRHADLKPITLGAVPMQSPLDDLRRYRIRSTDEVTWNEALVQVLGMKNPIDDDLYVYEIEDEEGTRHSAIEYELTIHEGSLAPDPADMLAQLDLAPWELVSARAAFLEAYFNATARSMGIVGYNGARMLPIPHQINAARYALQFGRVRFLLADEVGLGKTVEAGLILSTLRKYFPDWKTAIFVPESLTAQWAFEMYGKFGKLVFELSEDEDDDESIGTILPHQRAKAYAVRNKPEILVVDEAHRILHDPRLHQAFQRLSRNAHAVLLLTATPVADDSRNLLELFRLLDPAQFEALDSVEKMQTYQEAEASLEEFLKAVRAPRPDPKKVRQAWNRVGIDDVEIDGLILPSADFKETRHRMHRAASIVVDRYYPGARMLRYRRKFLAQDNPLPFRIMDLLEYRPTAEEDAVLQAQEAWLELLRGQGASEDASAQRLAAALIQAAYSSPLAVADWLAARRGTLERHDGVTADPVLLAHAAFEDLQTMPDEQPVLQALEEAVARWDRATRSIDATLRPLARTARYEAFLQYLLGIFKDEPDSHILVFTGFESNVHPLFLLLRKALTDIAEVFEMCGLQSRIEREKNAFEFQEFPAGSVLISDELGGEGRNFQFASHVLHYDVPLAPWIVEQRIGRCDRVGRDEEMDVDSVVLVAKGRTDEAFVDFLAEGVGVFNESIAPVEGELDRIVSMALRACIEDGATGVLDLIEETATALAEARERENAELLVRDAVGVEEAHRIAEDVRDEEELEELRDAALAYARLFESMVDEQEGGRVAVTVGEYHSLHGTPGVRGEMIGYFDRKSAVRHERLDFFSPGHPFIRAMAQMSMTESPDRAAIIQQPGRKKPALVCLYRVSIPIEFFGAVRELPVDMQPPLLSLSARLFATRMIRVAVDFEGNRIDVPDLEGEVSCLHDAAILHKFSGADWRDRVETLAEAALEIASDEADRILEEGREELEDLACEVFTRVHPDHSLAESEVASIMSHFEELHVDLDSVVVVLPA